MKRLGIVALVWMAVSLVALTQWTLGAPAKNPSAAAIIIILEARDSHLRWVEYFKANPGAENRMVRLGDVVGNRAFHEAWVEKYNKVLAVLLGSR